MKRLQTVDAWSENAHHVFPFLSSTMLSLFSILPYKKNSILGLYLPFSWSSPTGNSEFLNHSYTQTVVFGELENQFVPT